jgi:hypothetical protein
LLNFGVAGQTQRNRLICRACVYVKIKEGTALALALSDSTFCRCCIGQPLSA